MGAVVQPPHDDTWVTVFGFSQVELPLVVREFSRAGHVVQFGTFGEGAPQVNWVHIQYQVGGWGGGGAAWVGFRACPLCHGCCCI